MDNREIVPSSFDPPVDDGDVAEHDAPDGAARAQFEAMVRAHYPRLCNFASRYVDSRETAEDIVQEVFLSIWRRRTRIDSDAPLPYLYRAVMNRAVIHLRK